MEVEIISKETIRPSSSTPPHLRTYNLSLLDQIAPPVYVPVILFYSPDAANDVNPSNKSHHLKQAFSKTLTHFYPLAGRIQDDIFNIDCSDNGASYTEVNVAGDMSMVIQEPNIHQLEKLLPCNPYEMLPEISSQEILKAQVNYFECGEIAISICIWHVIGDATTAASFIKSWAAIASGGGGYSDIDNVVFDCTSIFPPQKIHSFLWRNFMTDEMLSDILMKRFVFDGSKVAALREEVGKGPSLDHPTRVEAIGALIWKAVMAATGKDYVAATVIDLRKRVEPPLPKNCIGNINQMAFAADCSVMDYNYLAGKIHESIKMINNEYVRKIHAGGEYLEHVRDLADQNRESPGWLNQFSISSWCRFPFYEADFGWGKPIWVTTALINRCAFLLDTKDGQGIEAWIGLPKEVMSKFEQNPDICTYASFTPAAI
ncbi:stemmadenine O-acetyltransferase [Ricinus communis]|uniref:3'-N-debenzoyl-2'-deoxytaxol N-benzoyltransferase, putative n=1 Tax=Ricinus communis TaxID=3988 RepID=B9RAL8_RICCO|nr:stemmadenine O-acetyltransferase [Ricinus communis]EEF51845.1 3'-N-debenzoyl-2'-deoxytaxol N-benzoyltransferase, putative [Ricinus communis]|eukprot:XP_002511243.1 salutaridinol 7-O-acetyltransferase [Ricinus communis]